MQPYFIKHTAVRVEKVRLMLLEEIPDASQPFVLPELRRVLFKLRCNLLCGGKHKSQYTGSLPS